MSVANNGLVDQKPLAAPHGRPNGEFPETEPRPGAGGFAETGMPNGKPFLHSLQLSIERLTSNARIAITTAALRGLLYLLVSRIPFDARFYIETYPDIAAAYNAGEITDLHEHFVRQGYFEGRLGIEPVVDEQFYLEQYSDVAAAVAAGDIASATDHFIRGGVTEGRFASHAEKELWEKWMNILTGP